MKKVGIIGGTGYTAGELIRLLLGHSKVEIAFVYSSTNAGKHVSAVHQDLAWSGLTFTNQVLPEVAIIFLCLGHGNSSKFLVKYPFLKETRIIDLSNEYRLQPTAQFKGTSFVYGLPELNRAAIKTAQYIANPGCFATAIQLALLPLASEGLLRDTIHIQGVTGVTGAGKQPTATTHFGWRDNNISHYKAFVHQHLEEIKESLGQLQPGFSHDLLFIPLRGNFSRGIFVTVYTEFKGSLEEAYQLFHSFYENTTFVKILEQPLHLKQVINTNFSFIHIEKHGDRLLITSILDNLLKGASGQAIENMNIMYGWEQSEGLRLKASYF